MFDPSKLDIDFSDTSDVYKIEKEKIKAEEKTEARRQEKARDVLSEIDSEDKNKDTIVLDNNKKAEDERFKKQDDTELDMHLNRKQDKETLSTIITDSELVEKDSELKAYKEQKEEERNNNDEEKILFDINIAKLGDLVGITLREKYDYFRIEPTEDFVRICFVKDNVDKEKKYIKYPAYSKILLEIKKAGKLKLDITEKEQKGKAEYDYLDRRYSTIVKTKPEATGEKVYFKIQEIAKVAATKKKDKISFSKILWFLVALLLTTLLIGGLFLGFVLFNSNSIADLKFFNDL
jgi:type II secretory ATPase GspE/PulE/Tfp pilus assembly ATPase PilB-like protein